MFSFSCGAVDGEVYQESTNHYKRRSTDQKRQEACTIGRICKAVLRSPREEGGYLTDFAKLEFSLESLGCARPTAQNSRLLCQERELELA